MFNYFLSRYKKIQTQAFLSKPSVYKKQYAIIGTGKHNISNLYPCIWHLGIPVKFVYSATRANAEAAAKRWNGCEGTNDISVLLNDKSVHAVIVAAPPLVQIDLIKKLLASGKHVYAEKPLAYSIKELNELISISKGLICQAGLQRRFAPALKILKQHCQNTISYNYRFCVGAYPEGDSIYEIFIHPVDNVIQLFGNAELENISMVSSGSSTTYFLILNHNGVRGCIELSTGYSWQQSIDEMIVNTTDKIFTVIYPGHVSSVTKPATFFKLPMEKIFRQPLHQQIYLDNSGFLPVPETNSLQLMGFYPALLNFTNAVEKSQITLLEQPESLLPAYGILEKIKSAH